MSYSTGTIDCSGLQTTTLYCDLQEDTHVITLLQLDALSSNIITELE